MQRLLVTTIGRRRAADQAPDRSKHAIVQSAARAYLLSDTPTQAAVAPVEQRGEARRSVGTFSGGTWLGRTLSGQRAIESTVSGFEAERR
jgi:hypothetical protein